MLQAIPLIVATLFSLYIAIIDIGIMRIPNRILAIGLAVTSIAMMTSAVIKGDILHALTAYLGGAISTMTFFLIHMLRKSGLGMGDVKFASLVGMAMSWIAFPSGLIGLAYGFVASAIFAIILIVMRMKAKSVLIPFAPFMVFGLLIIEYRALLQ